MKSKLLVTVAATAFSALLAAGSAFAQDELLPKHKQQPQGEAPATQQEPANKMEAPKKPDQAQQEPGTEQPAKKPAGQASSPAKKPLDNQDQGTSAERKQVGQGKCPAGEEANCPPSKTQKMGKEQPGKAKTNLGQQPEDQTQPKKPMTGEGTTGEKPKTNVGQQPEDQTRPKKPMTGEATQPGAKPAQTQTGATETGSRTDVDVVGSVNISKDKASRVRETLIRSGERSDVDVNVNINVGQALPTRVHPRALPADIVEIVPEYRGYDYVVVQDEIVIVEPQTRKVVEVIRQGRGGTHARAASKIRLTSAQRQKIVRYAREQRMTKVDGEFGVEAGIAVPGDVELVPLPDTIVTEVPAVRSYTFFVDRNDEVVLVDPGSRSVVEVIQ